MEKKKVTYKKYSVSMKTTNGTIISAIGNNSSITITNRIMVNGVQHFQCSQCSGVHPAGHPHLA